ncbi:MAG TPA: hypothetical protein VM658_17445 [bacterium]|nr:hypothetical protein [bacterium]
MRMRKIKIIAAFSIVAAVSWPARPEAPAVAPEQAIFPGQADPRISAGIIEAYNFALNRQYDQARDICLQLGREFPDNPAGPTGETVLYQVMMIENEDYTMDREFRDASARAVAAADRYVDKAPKNDWYYTLLGAAWGVQGIYFLRRDEYAPGAYYGVKGLYYMQTAEQMNEHNYEARLGIGLYLYYRSAYARFIPIPWLDQRERGIKMVKEAGEHRPYLHEVSRIALFYIYNNEKDYDRAFKYIDELIAQRPEFPIFYHFAGRALMNKGDYKDAAGYYLKMSEIDPALYFPYYQLGVCELNMGHKAEAKKWFEKFFAVLGDRDSVHRESAEKYMRQLQ